jgi:predicted Zn-dependent protease
MWALGHEGCFKEANALKLAKAADLAEARMLRLALDDDGLMKWAKQRQKDVFIDGYYIEGIEDVYRGKLDEARKMLPKLRRESPTWYGDPPPIFQQEVQARIDLASGKTDDAVGSLHHLAIKRDNTPQGHGWGQAAYYDEVWGEAALYAGELDGPSGADEAFHEAVAHEHGSIVGIVGLQVVAELRHDKVSVRNYAKRAAYTWERADPGALKRLTERMRKISQHQAPPI